MIRQLFYKGLILFYMLIFSSAFAQKYLPTSPYIHHYSSEVYKAYDQVWTIAEDNQGVFYYGTSSGLTIYDGTTWYSFDDKIIRALSIDTNNLLYMGSHGDFGYYRMVDNKYEYTSLPSEYNLADTIDIINFVKATSHGVYFLGYTNAYRLHNNVLEKLNISGKTLPGYGNYYNDRVFVYSQEHELIELINGKEKLIYKNIEYPEIKRLDAVIPFAKDSFLLASRFSGLYLITNKDKPSISRFKTNIDKELVNNQPYNCLYKEGFFIVGTITGGIYVINKKGKLIRRINYNSGLKCNSIYTSHIDKNFNLWIGSECGISKIELFSPASYISSGKYKGMPLRTIKFKDDLYLSSLQGVYYLNKNNKYQVNQTDNFIRIKNSGIECWGFEIIKNKKTSQLLFASNKGVGIITKDKEAVYLTEEFNAKHILQSKINPQKLFVATDKGLKLFDINFNTISLSEKHTFKGINSYIEYFCEDKTGKLWLSTEHNGLGMLDVKYAKDKTIIDFELYLFNEKNGIKSKTFLNPKIIDNKLIIQSNTGILTLDSSLLNSTPENYQFIEDTCFYYSYKKDKLHNIHLTKDYHGDIWLANINGIQLLKKNKNSNCYSLSKTNISFQITDKYINDIYALDSNFIVAAGTKDIYFIDKRYSDKKSHRSKVLFSKILVNNDSLILKYPFAAYKEIINKKHQISYNNNSIIFTYSSPAYNNEKHNKYSCILEGFDEKWNDWSNENKKEYTNLPPGKYSFKVKAQNNTGNINYSPNFNFEIKTPWFFSIYAIIGYFIIAVIIIVAIVKIYAYRLSQANKQLEKIVSDRTKEIKRQNDEIKQQNTEITQQKEELEAQAEELEVINKELEKLSIVASETDNAVLITNAEGIIEYANHGFTKLYSYELEEFFNLYGKNILKTSSYQDIQTIYEKLYSLKTSQNYTALSKDKYNKEIWVQTNITPILDENEDIVKLVLIDTDVTKIKNIEKELRLKNKNITNSINYAQRIQNALMPSIDNIKNHFNDCFILFKPRDIVSGDFYWMLNHENNTYFVVADCTGHGVPGAMMSMIGNTLLNEIILSKQIYQPAKILDELNANVVSLLKTNKDVKSQSDGMDISLIKYNKQSQKLSFALANHSIVFIDKNESSVIKGDFFSIGEPRSIKKQLKYTEKEYSPNKDTKLYMFSDGFPDQAGGDDGKKYGKMNLISLITGLNTLPLSEQKELLNKEFINWRGSEKQVDDVLLVGIKF